MTTAKYVEEKEAELLARLDETSGKRLSPEESKALEFERLLFVIRTHGL